MKYKCFKCGKVLTEDEMKYPNGAGIVHYVGWTTPAYFEHVNCGGVFEPFVDGVGTSGKKED